MYNFQMKSQPINVSDWQTIKGVIQFFWFLDEIHLLQSEKKARSCF